MTKELRDQLQHTLGTAYTLGRELGGGGMSRVFVAEDTSLVREVVVKVLPPELAAEVSVERFKREIALAARLQHAHIVPVLSAGESAGLPYYMMPFVDGESLRARLRREGELPLQIALKILRDVASALSYAHGQGVIHRDLKPANILLASHDALVADFGVAKAIFAGAAASGDSRTASVGLTSAGLALGTPAYMAPEQVAADPNVDQRADLYAFGCVAYEVLCGQSPFANRTTQRLLVAHLNEMPESLARLRPTIPAPLAQLVMRCLEKRPADRPQSANELVAMLDVISAPTSGARDAPSGAPEDRGRRTGMAAVALALVAVAAIGVLAFRARTSGAGSAGPSPEARSIAVLPFDNLGGDTANLYFADGMTDELATALSKLPGLQVAARSSAYAFQGKQISAQEIGRQLNVVRLLEGSVRRAGGRLRVTAQLVNATTGITLWSESFERELKDVFQVQDELTKAIASALEPALAGHPSTATLARASRGTEDLEAYDLYLQGHYFWARRGGESLRRAITLFQQAIARDPNFARAYAGLATCYAVIAQYTTMSYDSAMALTRVNGARALALDSTLTDAMVAVAMVDQHDWRFAEAERGYRRAIALDSTNATAYQWYGEMLYGTGWPDRALPVLRRAFELNPLSAVPPVAVAYALYALRRFDEAMAFDRRAITMDSTYSYAWIDLARTFVAVGQLDSAALLARRALAIDSIAAGNFGLAAMIFAAAGDRRRAEAILGQLRRSYASGTAQAMDVALGQAAVGASDSALFWLSRSVDRHEESLVNSGIQCDPLFDELKRDGRFQTIMSRMHARTCPAGPPRPRPRMPSR